jgi:two-component system sensor histidine kinase ChvG
LSPSEAPGTRTLGRRLYDGLFRIRTKLLIAQLFLVLVPVAGQWFARTYERELLKTEEEGLHAVAVALAVASGPPTEPENEARIRAAANAARAHIRLLDRDGHIVVDSGPEEVELLTRGRELISSVDVESRRTSALPTARLGDADPPHGDFRTRAEVARALAGEPSRAARRSTVGRGVRLFFAEPMFDAEHRVTAVVYASRTTYPVLVSLYKVRNGLRLIAFGSIALAVLVGSFLALTISRPLRRLTQAARRIASGERGVALKLTGRDEVGELARAFDAMAHELDARLLYISELAANVSHEFKTPIASIRGAAELLREGAADDPAARERFLGNILDDTERLARLVSRLLELSRIESQPDSNDLVDYRALVEDAVARFRASGADVHLQYEARHAMVRGSSDHLDSVLGNLVENGIRFAREGVAARIDITVRQHGDLLRTEVRDNGRGISEANRARVWERFFTTARERGGTGLGLAIVRAVVEQHGGTVGFESTAGEGTTFWFTIARRL